MKTLSLSLLLSLIALTAQATPGLRSEKTVLNGVLIRAGGPGGMHSMATSTVLRLCEEGVTSAYYLYPSMNFTNQGTYTCSRGKIEYKGGSFTAKGVRPILEEVMEDANKGSGEVLVHCWNGWHGAGEVSAYALMQFCDWSGDQAADYWAQNISDKSNLGKYSSVMNRIRRFQPFRDLRVSESVKARICP
jgi:hypothetical protein